MSRLVVVSNRVAPITEGEPTAGGLAAGVLDALKQKGGIWFGWSGEITDDAVAAAHVERTVGLDHAPHGRSGSQRLRRVLPRLRQRHAVADAALSGRPRALRLGGVFRISPGEHAVRAGARPTGAAGRSDLGARLPPALPGRGVARGGAAQPHGPVPAHAVSGARGVHDQPGARSAGPRDVPVRPARFPDRGRSQRLRRLRGAAGGWQCAGCGGTCRVRSAR